VVVGVFHLTHQIEITSGGSHGATILAAARRPALPAVGGHLQPPLLTQTLQLR
jgi:hypothetical protein